MDLHHPAFLWWVGCTKINGNSTILECKKSLEKRHTAVMMIAWAQQKMGGNDNVLQWCFKKSCWIMLLLCHRHCMCKYVCRTWFMHLTYFANIIDVYYNSTWEQFFMLWIKFLHICFGFASGIMIVNTNDLWEINGEKQVPKGGQTISFITMATWPLFFHQYVPCSLVLLHQDFNFEIQFYFFIGINYNSFLHQKTSHVNIKNTILFNGVLVIHNVCYPALCPCMILFHEATSLMACSII